MNRGCVGVIVDGAVRDAVRGGMTATEAFATFGVL